MAFLTGRKYRTESSDGVYFELLSWVIYVGRLSVAVPPGYVTDFASVPRWLWWLTPQSGRWNLAAIVHDYLITDVLPRVSSADVDATFRDALKELGVSFPQRWLMWAGVRWAAVVNPKRRPGWIRTLPILLFVTALALAPVAAGLALFL